MFGGAPRDEEKLKKLEEALGFLNTFLEGSKYAAGDNITIADHSLLASVSTIEVSSPNLTFPNPPVGPRADRGCLPLGWRQVPYEAKLRSPL